MNDSLETLLAEFIERREAGEALSLRAFSEEHPEAGDALVAALSKLGTTEQLFPGLGGVPESLGPWVLEEEIGRGGMGRVYRVHRAGEAAPGRCALKLLSAASSGDDRAVRRIEREGSVLRDLEHPGLVKVRDVGTSPHGPWIVMDFVSGTPLSTLISKARNARIDVPVPLGWSEKDHWSAVAELGAQMAEALGAAHDSGLVHRDVKPSNIIVMPEGRAVLIDFGLARVEGSRSLTFTGDVLGTPQYMAPEQARGERAGPRTDVWGLGATLFELCTLTPPTSSRDALAAIERLRSHRPMRLSSQHAVPRGLARVIDGALAYRPDRRPRDAHALAKDLRRVAQGDVPHASAAGIRERLEDGVRARPRAATGAALLFVALAVGGASIALRGDASGSAASSALVLQASFREATTAYLARDEDALALVAEELRAGEWSDGVRERANFLLALAGRQSFDAPGGDPVLLPLVQGVIARQEGRFPHAILELRVAAQRAGSWALPLVLLGEAAREAKMLDVCEREWTSAVRMGVSSADLYRRLGKVRFQRKDLEGAISAFRRAVDLGPMDWRNSAELARALSGVPSREARAEALAAVRTAIGLSSQPSMSLLNVKAALLDQDGRRVEARAIYREMVSLDPSHFRSRFNLAYSFDMDCRLVEARMAYEAAALVRPASVECQFALATIAAGSQCDTCAACREAVDAAPGLVDAKRVTNHLAAALLADDGSLDWLQGAAAELAITAGEPAALARVIDQVLDDRDEVDAWTVRLERARRQLRAVDR